MNSDNLWKVLHKLPKDYTDYGGQVERWAKPEDKYPDCSMGCKWFVKLADGLGADWGVCANPDGHRAGLLTWEHQGCQDGFEYDRIPLTRMKTCTGSGAPVALGGWAKCTCGLYVEIRRNRALAHPNVDAALCEWCAKPCGIIQMQIGPKKKLLWRCQKGCLDPYGTGVWTFSDNNLHEAQK